MAGRIANKLDEVRKKKENRDQVKITWESVSDTTGLAYSTVLRWANDNIKRYDDVALAKFCEYFDCQVGDILVYVKDE